MRTNAIKLIILISVILLAILCVKPADAIQSIYSEDIDADYCLDLKSDKPMVKFVKKHRDLEPILLGMPEKQRIKCDDEGKSSYNFYFFGKKGNWFYPMSSTMICISHGDCFTPTYEILPVIPIDFPESEVISLGKNRKKEDLLQFENKIIDVEIYKRYECPPSLDTAISIIFKARITGECSDNESFEQKEDIWAAFRCKGNGALRDVPSRLDSVIAKFKSDNRSFEEFIILGKTKCYGDAVDLYYRIYNNLYYSLTPFTNLFDKDSIKKSIEEYISLGKEKPSLYERINQCDSLFGKNENYKRQYIKFVSDKKNYKNFCISDDKFYEWEQEELRRKDYLEKYFIESELDDDYY